MRAINRKFKNEAFEKEGGPFWYFSKHGIGPGSLPKGVNVVETKEDDNYGTYVALDKVLTTKELKEYELKEKKPDLKESDDEDKPYTYKQIFDELKVATNNFTVTDDTYQYGFEKEVNHAKKILSKHYSNVDVDQPGSMFRIRFNSPIKKEKKSVKEDFAKSIDLDRVLIDVANMLDEDELGEDWIEVFPARETSPYSIIADAVGNGDIHRRVIFRAFNDYIDVIFKNGSEAKCRNAKEIARFIAGEFGIVLNESKNDDSAIVEDAKFYFGMEQSHKYGDMIAKELAGKTISKRIDLGEQPGGLVYEANKLGIDMWDLLEALEGMCYEGRAREIDDSTYLVTGNDSTSIDSDNINEFLDTKINLDGSNSAVAFMNGATGNLQNKARGNKSFNIKDKESQNDDDSVEDLQEFLDVEINADASGSSLGFLGGRSGDIENDLIGDKEFNEAFGDLHDDGFRNVWHEVSASSITAPCIVRDNGEIDYVRSVEPGKNGTIEIEFAYGPIGTYDPSDRLLVFDSGELEKDFNTYQFSWTDRATDKAQREVIKAMNEKHAKKLFYSKHPKSTIGPEFEMHEISESICEPEELSDDESIYYPEQCYDEGARLPLKHGYTFKNHRNAWTIDKARPYDDASYFIARYVPSQKTWKFVRDSKVEAQYPEHEFDSLDDIAVVLYEFNADIEPKMIHN